MVRIRATWVLLSDDELKSVSKSSAGGPLQEIDTAALAKLPNAVKLRGQTTCFNRQTVHITSGRARTVITDVDALVGQGAAAFEPKAELVSSGATLEITPVLSPDNADVTLDLTSVLSRWEKPEAAGSTVRGTATTQPSNVAGARPSGAASEPDVTSEVTATIDRLNMPVHSLATTIQLPVDRAILIGGMTLEPGTDDSKQLYLIIEASGGTASKTR
jgi:hypothetical protein